MSKHLRRRFFVDRDVQGRLLGLFIRCWAISLCTAGGLTVLGWIFVTPGITGFVGPNSFMVTILPMVLVGACAALLVLPLLLWDMVRVTHRFAGPLVRFKRHLREAAAGGPLTPLHFRDGDDWPELAEAYNSLLDRFRSQVEDLTKVDNAPAPEATTSESAIQAEVLESDTAPVESSVVVAAAIAGDASSYSSSVEV
jgi:hypothetical protein